MLLDLTHSTMFKSPKNMDLAIPKKKPACLCADCQSTAVSSQPTAVAGKIDGAKVRRAAGGSESLRETERKKEKKSLLKNPAYRAAPERVHKYTTAQKWKCLALNQA